MTIPVDDSTLANDICSVGSDGHHYSAVEPCTSVSAEKDLDEIEILFNFTAYGVLFTIIGVFGILGNVISTIVLSQPQMKSSINFLLIGIIASDNLLIIFLILMYGLPSFDWGTDYRFNYVYHVRPTIAPIAYPAAKIAHTASVYLTLVVTLERFVAVCYPLQARSLCTYSRVLLYMTGMIVFSILYNITRFWEVAVEQCMHPHCKVLVYRIRFGVLRNNTVYAKVYMLWMYFVFMYGLPFAALVYFNLRIYLQVRRANKERQLLSRHQRKEIGLARMLLCVVAVFVLCNLMTLPTKFLEAHGFRMNGVLLEMSCLMLTIGSSVNLVIFVTFVEKFRRLFFKLFLPRKLRSFWQLWDSDSPEETHDQQSEHPPVELMATPPL